MPLYQYRCKECGHELEAKQKFADDPLTLCPNCGTENGLFRVVQAAGIVFKGSGFYVNDSRGSKDSITSPAKKKEDTSSGSDSNGSSGSTEKPAAAAEKPAASSSSTATTSKSSTE